MLCFNIVSFIPLFKQSNSQSCNGFVSFKLLESMKNHCNNYWTNHENRKIQISNFFIVMQLLHNMTLTILTRNA